MTFADTAGLGGVAGSTIYLGLPMGRVSAVGDRARIALAMFSVGILAFIFMDVASHGQDIIQASLNAYKASKTGIWHVIGLFALLAAGFTVGTAGISAAESRLRARQTRASTPQTSQPSPPGSGQPTASGNPQAEPTTAHAVPMTATPEPTILLRTGMVIAVAIGLHNFAEGLAIGVSARAGAVSLATVLIIGFGLHNATEGFGIVGPLRGARPSWRWLGAAGLVAGGPTFLGSLLGYQVRSDGLELCFYALAAGAILYVVGEIWGSMRRYGYRTLGLYALAGGFITGVATDLIVTYGGG